MTEPDNDPADEFVAAARKERTGFFTEFWDFLRDNKKWWLAPILLAILALGALVLLGPGAVPFIYPLF